MTSHTRSAKLNERSFLAFLSAQFLGAFNDNVYKMIVSVAAVEFAANQMLGARYLAIAGAVFVVPFVLFAGYAGQIADRFSKTRVLQVTKSFEIVIMLASMVALKTHRIDLLLCVLFLLALQANFFSPAKYGVLPEMVGETTISRANGLVEFTTFLAIILGTSAGSFLFAQWKNEPAAMGGMLIAFAVIGFVCSLLIRHVPASGSRAPFRINPFAEVWTGTKRIAGERSLALTVLGNSYFWFAGALFQLAVILLGQETLHLSDSRTGLLVTALAAGIGAGSIVAGWLSADRIELGLVPCGAALLALFSIALGGAHSFAASLCWLAAAGFAGGLFSVPLNAYLQEIAGAQEKGRLLATNSFWNAIGIVLSSALLWVLHDLLGWTPSAIFIGIGILTLSATAYIVWVMPGDVVRLLIRGVMKIFFRVRVTGIENIPNDGGALIVSNHVSYADALLIGCVSPRSIRFLMWQPLYDNRWLNPVCRLYQTIPLPHGEPKQAFRALREARTELAAGGVVGIFPEGELTPTGNIEAFERGVEIIAHGHGSIPLIPIRIDGLWGHPASLKGGKAFASLPRFRHPVTITIGEPMPADAPAHAMRARIQNLAAESDDTLGCRLVRIAKKCWNAPALADSTGRTLTFGQTMTEALVVRRWIRRNAAGAGSIGLLFPASVDGTIANIAVTLARKTAVNLNYTAGPDHIRQAVQTCGITTVLAAPALAERVSLPGVIPFDQTLRNASSWSRRLTNFKARVLPSRLLMTTRKSDDVAAVIFSSGSTGTPKGVMLSHRNLIANTDAIAQVYSVNEADCILGALPFFHSFGYTCTLWFPLLHGFRAVFHANPTDAKTIGELTAAHRATFFLSTPTFCLAYLRKCTREQFASIRCFLVGAERLRPALAEAFEKKFGIALLEGYGCTEMGPVISVNTPDSPVHGSVGRPLPGVSVQIVDPQTFEPLPNGETGLLLVNGRGRMVGYASHAVRTSQALHGGFYVTGDLGFIDNDGFLHVVDRLARFSKIAGEMVPHGRIEDALVEIAGTGQCLVTAVPDERRSERLVVLYTDERVSAAEMVTHLENAGLPALWIPKRDSFFRVDAIPVLGTGKPDLKAARTVAATLAGQNEASQAAGC